MKRCLGCMEVDESDSAICPKCGYAESFEYNKKHKINTGTTYLSRYIIGRVVRKSLFGCKYIAWDGMDNKKIYIKESILHKVSV